MSTTQVSTLNDNRRSKYLHVTEILYGHVKHYSVFGEKFPNGRWRKSQINAMSEARTQHSCMTVKVMTFSANDND